METSRGAKQYNGAAAASRETPEEVLYGLADGGPADRKLPWTIRIS
jgi:hypothetical protein